MLKITDNFIVVHCDGSPNNINCKQKIRIPRFDIVGYDFDEYMEDKFGWYSNDGLSKHGELYCNRCAISWNESFKGGCCS